MPTYVYRRADGSIFEFFQSITADRLTTCPTTQQPVQRVITGGTGFILKGSGFYKTDYVDAPSKPDQSSKADASEKADSPSDSKSDTSETPDTKEASTPVEQSD